MNCDNPLLAEAVARLSTDDFLEIDQYGVSAKALSGLTEYYLVRHLIPNPIDQFMLETVRGGFGHQP